MRKIEEKLYTPVKYECDVLVAGGGVAGIASAMAAAREGARVILTERMFMLGGLATAGLVTIYLPLCDGEGRQVSFGIAEELLRLSIEHGDEGRYPEEWLDDNDYEKRRAGKRFEVQFNPHLFAISAERVLRELGVTILYGATVVSVNEYKGRITDVVIESKSGREAISVKKCAVDCTGDADLCQLSSAETATFGVGNTLAAWYYYTAPEGHKLKMHGFADVGPNSIRSLNGKRYTGLDTCEISDMMIDSHGEIEKDILKRRAEGEDIFPTCIASIPQLRKTRRLIGDYVMDYAEEHKYFEDSVGMVSNWKKRGPVYEIPFGTLRTAKVKNLLVAGRCISVTDDLWEITRVIPDCAVTGEAAGTAAAMTDNLDTLSVKALQDRLVSRGVVLHEKDLGSV
ncbi:MAG: FAD-dependent oxidoreductase [Clostridia bacterium]|nr:FAD-dependent oxidoreductase [Clostridia bacterium]